MRPTNFRPQVIVDAAATLALVHRCAAVPPGARRALWPWASFTLLQRLLQRCGVHTSGLACIDFHLHPLSFLLHLLGAAFHPTRLSLQLAGGTDAAPVQGLVVVHGVHHICQVGQPEILQVVLLRHKGKGHTQLLGPSVQALPLG